MYTNRSSKRATTAIAFYVVRIIKKYTFIDLDEVGFSKLPDEVKQKTKSDIPNIRKKKRKIS